MTRIVAILLTAITSLSAGFAAAAEAGAAARYTAALADGKRITGPEVSDWGAVGGTPKLGDHPLLGTGTPLRWLSDNLLAVSEMPDAFVEFTSGDRLPGKVVEARDDRRASSLAAAPHFIVEPSVPLADSDNKVLTRIRVVRRTVRRIVWQASIGSRYQPGTLLDRSGRKIAFSHCVFMPKGARLLTKSGVKQIQFDEAAELHLPQVDPWEAYYDELAVLSPDCNARLLQLETTAGLIATCSMLRFQVAGYSNAANPNDWHHLIQPAWSLDAFAVRHREIQMRRCYAPHEVPLSRIAPARAENRSAMHSLWRWQVNRNVHGRPLHSGKHGYGWGFGVHGLSELQFLLPPTADKFHTRLKLDPRVGQRGCARGVVTLSAGSSETDLANYKTLRQLYRSELLIGSQAVQETGNLQLPAAEKNQARLLTLAVDPVYVGRPRGADPLDVRDTLNWLEPLVLLNEKALAAEIRRRSIRAIESLGGWGLERAEEVPLRLIGHWDAIPGRGTNHRFGVMSTWPQHTFSRTMTISPEQKWLIISAAVPAEEAEQTSSCELQVRVDGEVVAEHKIPVRLSGTVEPRPLAVPLQSLAGRKVNLEIVQRLLDRNASNLAVDWRTIAFTDRIQMLREVFEDRAEFTFLPSPAVPEATTQLLAEGAYAGTGCVKITPGSRIKIGLGEMSAPIREYPGWGEFRYIRFAFRKRGEGHLVLELEHDGDEQRKLRYFAGRGDSPVEGAKRVWTWATQSDLPDAWIVETRDVYGDFGGFNGNLTGVILSGVNCRNVLFDHIYLGRTEEDFELVQVERIATPEAAAAAARAAMAQVTLEKALPASVLIKAEDRAFSGVVVSKDGLVLTVGHAVVGPKRDVTLVLADGREVNAQILGVDRANDAAMVRITDQGEYPFVQIAPPLEDLRNELLLGVAHQAEFHPGQRPMADLTRMRGEINGLIWTDALQPIIGSGGPLLIATSGAPGEGKLIGVHSRYAWGGFLYTPIGTYRENWDRLKKGEVWGTWGFAAGPLMGIFATAGDGGCKINQVVLEGPAHGVGLLPGDLIKAVDGSKLASDRDLASTLAHKDPGQEVNIQIERAGRTLDVKMVLGRRR